uniref:Uncharacterized protein n=1 Tax=Caenorhabditis japonica TaxID=281687 RepID=A0A8R1HSQ2_CAEJA
MSAAREFSHITLVSTPFKAKIDTDARKSKLEIEKDLNTACKCADRFNYNANLHRKVTLSDRFELAAFGFEMKAKPNVSGNDLVQTAPDYIYRKERRQESGINSPHTAGMSPQNPLPAGRGFISPPAHAATRNSFVNRRGSPHKHSSPVAVIRPPIFDNIPSSFV